MIRPEFDMIFEELCVDNDTTSDQCVDKADFFFKKFRYVSTRDFAAAVHHYIDNRTDKYKQLPTAGQIWSALNAVRRDNLGNKQYGHCPACNGLGQVSMMLQFKESRNDDGKRVRRIAGKRFWSIEQETELNRWDVWPSDGSRDIREDEKTHDFVTDKATRTIYFREKREPWYQYVFHCRCDKGEDLHSTRRGGYQISHEEYEELKACGR